MGPVELLEAVSVSTMMVIVEPPSPKAVHSLRVGSAQVTVDHVVEEVPVSQVTS
jgi:hypothetical protein